LLRPQAMGFWAMVVMCWPVMLLFGSIKSPDWLFAFVFFTVSITAWTAAWAYYVRRRPVTPPVEKVEFAAFWITLLSSFAIIVSASLLLSAIAYSILLIDGVGLLLYCIPYFYSMLTTHAKMTTKESSVSPDF